MDPPLQDLRVLDLSDRLAGAYCTKLLTDAGADVVKVEPPGGDPLRRWSPSGEDAAGDAPLFHYLCAGKRSVESERAGPAVPTDLLRWTDVVVVTASAARAAADGLDAAAVAGANPSAVLVSISDFGWTGPWAERAATEFTLQSWCGATGFRGFPDGPPVSVGGRVGEYVGGVYAAVGALAGRRAAVRGAGGGHVDVSLLECMTAAMQGHEWLHTSLMRLSTFARSVEVPSIEPARDGWVGMSMVTGQQWLDFAAMVERPLLAEDPQLRLQLGRWPRRQEVYALIHPWLAERTVDEIVELASLFRVPMAPVGNGASIRGMDHFVERGVFVANPAGFAQPRPPWRMTGCQPAPVRAAPRLGAHTDECLREAGRTRSRTTPSSPRGEGRGLPLSGVRVIDFTAFWAGPSATFLVAALGADVVKVESVQRPDGMRFAGGPREGAERWWEYSWIFHGVNADKRSVTLDLTVADGVRLAKRLVAGADAVVENFSPRVMDEFGLGWEELRAVNPRLVMVRMPAFGLDGPWRDRVGFAPTMEQLSGMAWLTGFPDGPPMAPRGACDPIAGAHAALALMAALDHRDRVGDGQLVELPMIEVALNVTAEQVIEHEVHGVVLERRGNRGAGAPQNVYACAGDDDWVALAVMDDDQWHGLRRAMGLPSWADEERLSSEAGRRAQHDRLDALVGEWCAGLSAGDAAERLAAAGVPAAPVVLPPDVVVNPQLRARGFFEPLVHPEAGEQLYAGLPFRPAGAGERWCRTAPPLLGQHNDDVLGEELGLTAEDLEDLRARRVTGDRPLGL